MRSRTAKVDRIDAELLSLIPCYRNPAAVDGGRVGRDGKVYPIGERWDWRRIELRREAVASILDVEPGASIRVVRDVLIRYGHRVSHEQVRHDVAHRTPGPPTLVESRRWLTLEESRDETSRRRGERRRSGTSPGAAARRQPIQNATTEDRMPALSVDRQPPTVPQSAVLTASEAPSAPEVPTMPAGARADRRDGWAVWDDAARRRGAS